MEQSLHQLSARFGAQPAPSSSLRRISAPATRSLALRAVLLFGSLAVGLTVAALAHPSAFAEVEPQLTVLLQGMAFIKAGITLAALGLVYWRFGSPVSSGAAVGYIVGVCCFVAASVLIAMLTALTLAAVVFHVGLFGLLFLALREDRWRIPHSNRGHASRHLRPAHEKR